MACGVVLSPTKPWGQVAAKMRLRTTTCGGFVTTTSKNQTPCSRHESVNLCSVGALRPMNVIPVVKMIMTCGVNLVLSALSRASSQMVMMVVMMMVRMMRC